MSFFDAAFRADGLSARGFFGLWLHVVTVLGHDHPG
jgi:hypothetical protein